MLETIRKGKQGVVFVLLVGFIALLMVGFGVDVNNKQPHLQAVVKVNDYEVSQQQFYNRHELLSQTYREQFGPNFDQIRGLLRLEQRTVDQIVQEYLLSEFIESLGLSAGKAQVEDRIKNHPFFARNPLNEQNFKFFLQAQGLTAARLEEETKKGIAAEQLENIISDTNTPTEQELRAAFQRENTKSEFAYVAFRAKDFEPAVDTSDETKLKEYFEKNADRYQKPRTVQYEFVKFDPMNFTAKVLLEPQDIEEVYESRISEFEIPMQVKVRELVIKKPAKSSSAVEDLIGGKSKDEASQTTPESEEAKRKKVTQLHEQLEAGADFVSLARENSENPQTAPSGGERGWVSVTDFEKPAQKELEKLEKGLFTDVVESSDAWTIYFADEVKEATPRPLEEVRAQLENELRIADAPEYARLAAEDFIRRWEKEGQAEKLSLVDFAKKENLPVGSSEGFLSATENPIDPAAGGLTAKVINLPKGTKEALRVGMMEFVVDVTDQRDPVLPEFAEAKEQVLKEYIAEKSKELARTAAESSLRELRGEASATESGSETTKKSIQQIAAAHSLQVKSTEPASRMGQTAGQSAEELLANPELRQAAFTLSLADPFPRQIGNGPDGTYYIYQLLKEIPPAAEDFEKARGELLQKEQEKIKSRAGAFILEGLKAEANIWVDPSILVAPQGVQTVDL